MQRRISLLTRVLLLSTVFGLTSSRHGVSAEPNQTPAAIGSKTLTGKVMVGYQGWFNCPGDGMDFGWGHWSKNRKRPFGPGNATVDLWPDVSELKDNERFPTGFRHQDGRVAEVFSSAKQATVERHFHWMKDYGIDGAFLQRFANGLSSPVLKRHKDTVLSNVRQGARKHGRVYAVMYDLSGLRSGQVQRVAEDWDRLQTNLKITDDAGYLHHQGKPLVAVWGVGFSDDRKYSLQECAELVSFLKQQGCAVMVGVPSFWREGKRDATSSPKLQELLEQVDVISPWTVGRYRTPAEAEQHADTIWKDDVTWCRSRGIDFLPVVYPGFSWHNLTGAAANQIPRRGERFLWSQAAGAHRVGCEMIYVAMFDEVDEGTAIFKCTNDPPVGEGVRFIDYEGLPPDHYLKLTGRIGKLLRGEADSTLPEDVPGE